MKHRLLPLLALVGLSGLLLYTVGCDSADNPVAPTGSVLTLSATPTRIALTDDFSTISVIGFKPDGNPLNPGTQITLSTTLGVLAETIIEAASGGRASTTLTGDGTPGDAMITASLPGSGEGAAGAMVVVQIGGSVLTLTANPTRIALNGTSTITVIGLKPDGNPLNPGTQITLSTTLGVLAQPIIEVTSGGRASTTLSGDGIPGIATITASLPGSSGGAEGAAGATVDVQVGETAETRPTLSITASPNIIGLNESAQISAIARNSDGSLLGRNHDVALRTDLGSLLEGDDSCSDSAGLSSITVETESDGVARATLCAGDQPGTATITGSVGSSDEAMTTVTIENQRPNLIINANPDNIDSNETSVITIFARDNNDVPLGSGFEIQLTSTLGRLSDESPTTDSDGRAESELTTNSDVGQATVSAFLGSSSVVQTTVDLRDEVAVLSLQATPTEVDRSESTNQVFNIVAVARNDQNDPISGESVNFGSPRGSLASGGLVVLTNTQGEATDTLTIIPDEAANISEDSFEITVTSGNIITSFTITVVD